MSKTELEIIIDDNGEVHLDIKGARGKKCVEIAELVEKIIGEMKSKKQKPEFYESDVHISSQIDTEEKHHND
ncbi:MAG: DUF2997 domain-containing protein [candidate division WOR-3 bacterium]